MRPSSRRPQAQAGSLLLNALKAKPPKLTAGQPLTPKLQQDLADLASLLETQARQKYEAGFKTTTSRYGLTDEVMKPAPGATTSKYKVTVE